MHVGSLVIFEDSGFSEDDLYDHIGQRLHLVPRFRKKLAWVPLGQGRPIWIDDPHFDLRFHIRYTGLPKPGGIDEAKRLMGRVMSHPLDRARPLWEMWVFDLPDGRRGLIHKAHHCLIDGISGVDLATVLLDFSEKPKRPRRVKPWKPKPRPSKWQLLRDTWAERLTRPSEWMATLQKLGEESREHIADRLQEVSQGLVAFHRSTLDVAPRTSLNVPIGPHRRFEMVRIDLDAVKAVKNRHDCKVNDVVLALVTGGLRHILQERGDLVDGLVLKAMVPVSVRGQAQRNTYGNMVSMMTADLPVGEPDPAARLERIRNHMAGIKESKQAVGADFWLKVADFAPTTLLSLAGRAVAFQRMFNLVVTNVPGPQFPLYLLGGRLLEVFPFVPLVGTAAAGVAILSYCGRLYFGISGDWDAVPDLQVFAEGIGQAVRDY
jgi:WS/DGAT/MGAT family acyltransferase